ncbi:MAG TPA: aldolase/citrate lyase family protein [Rhizobium sp.]
MYPNPSKLRQKLQSGDCVFGTAIYSYSPNMVEAAALSGIDFVRIDSEHAWRRDDSMDHMVRAALLAGVTPLIRIDRDDHYLARKAFEIGAGGIIVSNVTSVEEAKSIVSDARFPPIGRRGVGTLCLAGRWGQVDEQAWVDWNNREPLVGIMIESADAVEDIDAIMAVEGIDFALFGPADFGMSLSNRDPAHLAEQKQLALAKTARAARRAGKHLMYGVPLLEGAVEKAVSLGVDMVELSHDVIMVRTMLGSQVAKHGHTKSLAP